VFFHTLTEKYLAKNLRNITYALVQGGSNMTGTYAACLHRNQSRSYLNHLVFINPLALEMDI